jgi:glycerol-3-phosphate acyltransferase PlsX
MEDSPGQAWRRKPDSSMRRCFDLVARAEADAVVSAGNSGAMLACGLFVLGRIDGVDRPGIITTFPLPDGTCALLDMGANVEVKPSNLAQFAAMGAEYARHSHKKARPRVGLLSNGAEAHKGTELTRGAHELLAHPKAPLGFDYVGYVEGRDIFGGSVDVVVTDGFTGNVVLKTAEGVADTVLRVVRSTIERPPADSRGDRRFHALSRGARALAGRAGALLLRGSFREMKRRLDWAEYGGAPLLGVKGVVMICHGASPPRAIKNAILGARTFIQTGLMAALREAITRQARVWEPA